MADDVCVLWLMSPPELINLKSGVSPYGVCLKRTQQGTQMGWNNSSSTAYIAGLRDQRCPGDKGYSVRMQQEHFGKYSVLEQGKSWGDRQALTSLTAQSSPDCWYPQIPTVDSVLHSPPSAERGERESRRQQKLSAISDFSLFLSPFLLKTFSLTAPPLCLPLPLTLFLTFSATFSLSSSLLPSLPPSSVCLWSFSAALLRLPLLCSPILF